MSTWTKADIQRKVRQVTGRFTENDLTTTDLDDRINKFYQYTFPAEVKLERNHTYYEFLTSPNESYYNAPDMFTNFEPPALLDMQPLDWYQDPALFFLANPVQITSLNPWTGDGITAAFTTTLANLSVFPGTLVITDNTEVFEDKNNSWTTSLVSMTGSLGGTATVNYATGAVTVGFFAAPTSGQTIKLSYTAFTAGTPYCVLWFNNQFQFFNVPDTAYRFRVKAYTKLDPLVNATDRPLLDQWGPCIALGTARDIHMDYGEIDAYSEVTALYKEQVAYVLNRTNQNLLNTRALPAF